MAMVGFHESSEVKIKAGKDHPDRFFFDMPVNPNIEVKLKHQTDA